METLSGNTITELEKWFAHKVKWNQLKFTDANWVSLEPITSKRLKSVHITKWGWRTGRLPSFDFSYCFGEVVFLLGMGLSALLISWRDYKLNDKGLYWRKQFTHNTIGAFAAGQTRHCGIGAVLRRRRLGHPIVGPPRDGHPEAIMLRRLLPVAMVKAFSDI